MNRYFGGGILLRCSVLGRTHLLAHKLFAVWVSARLHNLNVQFREIVLRRRGQICDTVAQSRRVSRHWHQTAKYRQPGLGSESCENPFWAEIAFACSGGAARSDE